MRFTAFLALVCVAASLLGQQVEVTRYDVAQGLPQSLVNHVLQDADGFIWIGTGDGLARFDGHQFRVYKHDPRDAASLQHNSIWGLALRDDGQLWVSTRTGMDRLDGRTGRFIREPTGAAAPTDGCWRLLHAAGDRTLFYSPLIGDLLHWEKGRPHRRHIPHLASYVSHYDPATGVLTQLVSTDTVLTVHPDGASHAEWVPNPGRHKFTGLLRLRDRWLVLTSGDAWTWSPGEGRRPLPEELQPYLRPSVGNKLVARAPDGSIWLGLSAVGMLVLDEHLRLRQVYPLLPPNERPLEITCIAFDRQGNTWVGSDGKGVFKIAPQRIKFGRCMPGQGLLWEPTSWFVRGFAQWDEHQVLVSFYQGGLALFDERTGQLSPAELPAATKAAMAAGDLRRPFRDRQGIIWGQDDHSVFGIDPRDGWLVHHHQRPWLIAVLPGPDGVAILVDGGKMARLLPQGGRWVAEELAMPGLMRYIGTLPAVPANMHAVDDQLFMMSSSVAPVTAWRGDERIPLQGVQDHVRMTSVATDGRGGYWMTTNDGAFQLDSAGLQVRRHWTIHDGLPDQFLYGMLPDDRGGWWISSNDGLCHLDPAQGRCTNFTVDQGLPSKEFNSNAFFRSASGCLYFGGVNGFIHFPPGLPITDPDVPQVAIVALTVQDSLVQQPVGFEIPRIKLPYGRNLLRIDLAVLEMTDPDRNRYRYRVRGYGEWTEHPADRPLELTNMPDGDWTVEVAGVSADGRSSTPHELLVVHVPLPFWASPWAFVLVGSLVVLAVGGIAFLLYRRRVNRRMERAEQQMKELRIRARIAQDLHDDVGSGLARITVLARSAERRAAAEGQVADQVRKVRELSQELMDDLRDVVWVNDPRGGELADLLLRIRDHVLDLFAERGVECRVHLPSPLPERTVGSAAKRNLYLIAKEAAHNAYKYSGAARVDLVFALEKDHFRLELCDHGRGLGDAQAMDSGHGLVNMRQRATELGCTLTVDTPPTGGTRVRLVGEPSALDL